MKIRQDNDKALTDFKLLSFDCFGTLIDWRSGIYVAMKPLIDRLPASNSLKTNREALLDAFDEAEMKLLAHGKLDYKTLLSRAYTDLSRSLSLAAPAEEEAASFAASIGQWKAFPDTVQALQSLQKHYKLVILSNVDNESFQKVLQGAFKTIKFDAVYTAEDIGSYKPDLNNFHYLLRNIKTDLQVEPGQVLHTAHSLTADHIPAKQMSLSSAWIARGDGNGGPGTALERCRADDSVAFTWQFDTMGEMAAAVTEEFTAKA